MRSRACAIAARTAGAAAACIFFAALTLGAAQAQSTPYVMKITTPTIHAAPDLYARNLAAAVEKDSGGRIKGQVYPASQLGSIPRQIEGTQFGSIQVAVIPPEFFVGVDQRFEVMAAPGLISSHFEDYEVFLVEVSENQRLARANRAHLFFFGRPPFFPLRREAAAFFLLLIEPRATAS